MIEFKKSDGNIAAYLLERLFADAFDIQQFLHRRKRAVFLAVCYYSGGFDFAYSAEFDKFPGIRRVDVDKASVLCTGR